MTGVQTCALPISGGFWMDCEGESHTDYPGVDGKGNEGYDFSFENDNMERLVKEVVRERLDERGDK